LRLHGRNLLLVVLSSLAFLGCRGDISRSPDAACEDGDASGAEAGDPAADFGDQEDDAGGEADEAGGDPGPVPEQDWDRHDLTFRRTVTLMPHPQRARTDLPVLVTIDQPNQFVLRDIAVFERRPDGQAQPLPGWAFANPDGGVTQVAFTAPGVTPAGTSRQFLVYYRTAATPEPWQWRDTGWVTRQQLPGSRIAISGGCCELSREVDEAAGRLLSGRRTSGAATLRLLAADWRVAEGFSNSYQLQSNTTVYQTQAVEAEPFSAIHFDADEFQGACAVTWNRHDPVDHLLTMTQRVFRDWPFLQFTIAVSTSAPDLTFSSNDWSSRYLYLSDSYDRMVSDTRGDESIAKIWDTNMRWLVVYDQNSGRGFGWFIPHRGVIRADAEDGPTEIFDSYGYSAGGDRYFSALWMAAEDKNDIVDLFDALKPGVQLSSPESRDLNIVEPVEGTFYFPDDTLRVVVSTPGNSLPVSALLTLADGTELPLDMQRVDNGWIWESTPPLLLTVAHPPGSWTIETRSGNETRRARIEFRHPQHPRLLFSATELDQLRARRNDSHAEIWNTMLGMAAGYPEPMDDPGPGRDIRSYADRLINLALIQLLDPGQPYDELLWNYFFKMLRYPNWTSSERPFNNYDLTVGHFFTALALAYDWHYQRLTPDQRRELRTRLADLVDDFIERGWLRHYPDIDWTHYVTVTNNHYWIRNAGVAAVAYVLQEEMEEERRQAWQDRTEANLSVILSVLEADGTSNEGVAYHSYGQINLFPWLDMRDRVLGGQSALSTPWFANSILWDLYSITPGGDDNYGGPANFGDCPPYHYNPPRTIQAWLAARLDNGHAQWLAENLQWPRLTAFSYLWYDPTVVAVDPDTLPPWSVFENKGIFVWRSSWNNDATYFSLKAGSYFGGHEQPDAGHFILHRAGVPYITDYGYSYWKMTDEHNLILVDGTGQYGQDRQWMAAVDPQHWATLPFLLASTAYFDLVADPTPMYQSPHLQSWQREVVGITPGIFLVRDVMEADQPVTFTWLLHSYRTDPPTSENRSYSYRERRLENPWEDQGSGSWLLRPQDAAPALHVKDCSSSSWSAVVEPGLFVPEQDLDAGGYNENLEPFQLGYRLRRDYHAAAASSLVAAWFDAGLEAEPLTVTNAEGVRLYDGNGNVVVNIWPFSGAPATLAGLTVQGLMGGIRRDRPAFWGRELTRLENSGQVLVQAQSPLSLFARTEHAASADDPHLLITRAASTVTVSVYCPDEPGQVTLDGNPLTFSWNQGLLSLEVPAGRHRLEMY